SHRPRAIARLHEDMDDLFERFELAVDGIARLGRYPHVDRHQAWLDRLRVNLPELSVFERLRPEPELGYLSQPAAGIVAGGAPLGDAAGGIAAIARECRATPERAVEPAQAALAAALQHENLNAFITLADPAALDTAAAAAARRLHDGASMPLMGVPVAVKD